VRNYNFYLVRGDVFRLLMQSSSGQLKVTRTLMRAQYGIPHCLHMEYM